MRGRAAFFGGSAILVAIAVACSSSSDGGGDAPIPLPDRVGSEAGADAADDVTQPDPDAATGSFTPASFGARLVFWLDATKGIGVSDAGKDGATAIVSWADQSALRNDALQPVAALQPVVVGGAHPYVGFDGTDRIAIKDNPTIQWGKDDFAIATVVRYTNPQPTFALVVGKYDLQAPFPGPNIYANYFAPQPSTAMVGRIDGNHVVASSVTGCNDGKPHVVVLRRTGTGIDVRVDDKASANAEAGAEAGGPIDVTAPDADIVIGNRPNGTAGLRGDVAEVIGIRGTVTDAEVSSLESYLRAKWGL